MVTKLKKVLRRRIGRLVVEITREGITYRGHRCRRWRWVSWEQIASLAGDERPAIRLSEAIAGSRVLVKMNAIPKEDEP